MMESKLFKDWLFRYQYVYRNRKNYKKKSRFISALVTDIAKIREDVKVIEYGKKNKELPRNIYVGDIQKAETIITAYYDTPTKSFSPYVFFNKEKEKKEATIFILLSSVIMLIFGLLATIFYTNIVSNPFSSFSFLTIFIILLYGIYFYFFSKITRGLAEKNTLIRNSSSILTLLIMIKEIKNKNIAFAFTDQGVYGEAGLEILKESTKNNAEIYVLDSVGADAPLHLIGSSKAKKRVGNSEVSYHFSPRRDYNYLISARTSEENSEEIYYLNQNDLKQTELNKNNIIELVNLFK